MFKTFAGRFFIIYAVSTLVIFIVFIGIIVNVISNHFIDIRQDVMVDESYNVSRQYKSSYLDKESSKVAFIYQLRALGKNINSRILILDESKSVIIDSSSEGDSFIGTELDAGFINSSLESGVSKKTGNFDGYYDSLHLMTSVYFVFENGESGYVVMLSPYPNLQKEIKYSYSLVFISLIILLSITFITTYYFSRSISNAISALSDGAKRIAGGDFSTRIEFENYELSELSDNMNYMANELENLENMRRDFISNISHDLRSPLTSIKGFVTALMDGTIEYEDKDKYLKIILDESDRLSKLTDDIMLLTKMENNVLELENTTFEIATVIKKVCAKFEGTMNNKNQTLTLKLPKKEVFVVGDVNKITRVITNILDNAVKFTPNDGEIEISTKVSDGKILVSIADTGIGISKENLLHVWQRFHKVDKSRGMDKKGTGLGLAIVSEIIKAHGEVIYAKSEIGKGSTFTFSLKLA